MDDWKTWPRRFRQHMRKTGQTQETLGEALGVSQGAIGHWLRGRNKINLEDFFRLCAAAKADPRLILFGESTAQAALAALQSEIGGDPKKQAETPPVTVQ